MSNVHLLVLAFLLLTKSFWALLKSLIKNSTSFSDCHTWSYSFVGHLGFHHFLELSWCCLFCSLGKCSCFTSDSNWQLVGTLLTGCSQRLLGRSECQVNGDFLLMDVEANFVKPSKSLGAPSSLAAKSSFQSRSVFWLCCISSILRCSRWLGW